MGAFVQSVSKLDTTPTTNSTSLAYTTQNLTVGNLLCCALAYSASGQTCTVSDNVNGSWTPVGVKLNGTGANASFSAAMFFFWPNTSAGKPTVTLTTSGTNSVKVLGIFEYSGVARVEGTPVEDNILGTIAPACRAVVPASSSDIIFSLGVPGTNVVNTVNSPFTLREEATFGGDGIADNTSPTAGTPYACTFNLAGSDDTMTITAIFTAQAPIKPPWVSTEADRKRIPSLETGGAIVMEH